ncbi:protein pxr1-like [Willisornis vidua]|uniref:Protein pxr1-like n=1 Tax=Willisornis vidua TaxID=1566151 RepID=A0ABQ9CM14_9PASS|nr:protein pxr1-like [Willisornis vidua]
MDVDQVPEVKMMVRQAVNLQPMEVRSGANIHFNPIEDPMLEEVVSQRGLLSHEKPTLEQAAGRTCGPIEREDHVRAGFLAGLAIPWGTHMASLCS